jgi:hypothetical protein
MHVLVVHVYIVRLKLYLNTYKSHSYAHVLGELDYVSRISG